MKKMRDYEAPQTRHFEVELENGFMNASLGDDPQDTKSITINEQTPGIAIGGDVNNGYTSFTDSDKWDDQIQP